jgi:hypothetical protein
METTKIPKDLNFSDLFNLTRMQNAAAVCIQMLLLQGKSCLSASSGLYPDALFARQ